MAVTFPDQSLAPQLADTVEFYINPVYDHVVAYSKHGKAPGELWNPKRVAIHPTTNHIYVAEGADVRRVSVFSETGEFINIYSHKDMRSLQGIAMHGDNLYVTDCILNGVFHFKIGVEFRLVAKIGSYGNDKGEFNFPRQLAISANGDLYIADCMNNRIQVLDSSLRPIRKIEHPSMHRPCDVKLTKVEMYVLSDEDNPCVHVFSYSGHKIRSLISCGGDMQVTSPFCFCIDASNNILISDYVAHKVKIFSDEGALLHTLGQYGNEVGLFFYLKGLALTSDQKLATVSDNRNYKLQIFLPFNVINN